MKQLFENTVTAKTARSFLGSKVWSYVTILIFSLALLFGIGTLPVQASGTSPGSGDIFSGNHTLLSDQELLIVTNDLMEPNYDHYQFKARCLLPKACEDGATVDIDDASWTKAVPSASWEVPAPEEILANPNHVAVTSLRDENNKAFLAEAWCPQNGGEVFISLARLNEGGFREETAGFKVADSGRSVTCTAGNFTGNGDTELVAVWEDESQELHFAVMPASADAEPLLSQTPEVLSVGRIRIATGDVDANGVDEVALLYLTPDETYEISLFTVSSEGDVSLLASKACGAPGYSLSKPRENHGCFDLVFVNGYGSGKKDQLLCTYSTGTTKYRKRYAFKRFQVDLSEGTCTLEEFETTTPSDSNEFPWGRPRLCAGDLNGDGKEEAVFGRIAPITSLSPLLIDIFDLSERDMTLIDKISLRRASLLANKFDLAMGNFNGQLMRGLGNVCQIAVAFMDLPEISFQFLGLDETGKISTSGQKRWTAGDTGASLLSYGPFLAVADLDGDSMLLGEPIHLTLQDKITPLLFLEEPPKHVDGNASGDVENYTRRSDLFIQYAKSEAESNSTTSTLEVGADFAAKLETAAGGTAGADIPLLGKAEASVESKHTFSAATEGKYGKIDEAYSSRSTSLSGQTNRDDYVLFRCHSVHVWRYPILGWNLRAESSDMEGQAYYQVILPDSGAEDQAVHLMPGLRVDWYQPVHMNGNVLSYPSSSAQIAGFSQDDLLSGLVTLDVGGGNSASRTVSWSSESVKEDMKSLKQSMAYDYEMQMSSKVECMGNKASASLKTEVHADGSLLGAKTGTTSITKENAFDMEIPAISSPLAYSMTPLMYKTSAGLLKAGHLVGNVFGDDDWSLAYEGAPDVALNLPRTWKFAGGDPDEETWEWNGGPGARKIRGIFFRDPATDNDLGMSIPLGKPFTVAVRVHNFSLIPIHSPVTVLFEAATVNRASGTWGKRFPLGTAILNSISEWGAPQANWKWVTLTPDTSQQDMFKEGNYRIFVTLDSEGQLHERPGHDLDEPFDNNRGYFDVFFHQPDGGENRILAPMEEPPRLTCSLEASAPQNDLTYTPGEQITFRGKIANESNRSVHDLVVFFYDGNPDNGGQAFDVECVPGILPGETAPLTVDYPFTDEGPRQIFMKVSSIAGYTDNTARVDIPMEDGSGGCTVGTPGYGEILGMILLTWGTLFMMRRN